MIAICERTSIEITLENATNYAVYALLRLFSIIDALTDPNTKNDITEFNRMSAAVSYAILRVNFGRLSD